MRHWPRYTQTLLLAGVLLPLVGWGQSRSMLDIDHGIGALKLETPLDSLPETVYVGRTRGAAKYHINDPGWIGLPPEIRLEQAAVFVDQQRILAIELRTTDSSATEALLRFLQIRYGPGQQTTRAPHYTWHGQATRLQLDQNLLTGAAVLLLTLL